MDNNFNSQSDNSSDWKANSRQKNKSRTGSKSKLSVLTIVLLVQAAQEGLVIQKNRVAIVIDAEIPFEVHAIRIPRHIIRILFAQLTLHLILFYRWKLKQLLDVLPHDPFGEKL